MCMLAIECGREDILAGGYNVGLRLESVKENILVAQQRQKEQYDHKHSNPEIFTVGALVLKKDFTRKKRAGGKLDSRLGDNV